MRKAFSRYVSEETLDKIVGEDVAKPDFQECVLHFVIVELRADQPTRASHQVGLVSELAGVHDGYVDSIVGGLVVVVFGTLTRRGVGDPEGFVGMFLPKSVPMRE